MLQINDPCPVRMNQLQKTGENCYFCKGCNEPVIDFRNATNEEIQAYKGQKICGIFRNDQLDIKPVFYWKKAILFRLMACASFFGFAVSPVHADELVPKSKNLQEITAGKDKKKPEKEKKRRRHRRHGRRTVGAYAYEMNESTEINH